MLLHPTRTFVEESETAPSLLFTFWIWPTFGTSCLKPHMGLFCQLYRRSIHLTYHKQESSGAVAVVRVFGSTLRYNPHQAGRGFVQSLLVNSLFWKGNSSHLWCCLQWKQTLPRSDTAEEYSRRCFGSIYNSVTLSACSSSLTQHKQRQQTLLGRSPALKWQSEGVRLSLQRQKPGSAAAKCTGYFWQNGVSFFSINFTSASASGFDRHKCQLHRLV